MVRKIKTDTEKIDTITKCKSLIKEKKYQSALNVLFGEVKKNDCFETNELIAISLANLGKYSEAIEYFQKLIVFDVSSYRTYFDVAVCYYNIGKYYESIENLRFAISNNFKNYNAYNLYGLSHYQVGDYEEAVKIFHIALNEQKTDEILKNIGNSYYKIENYLLAQKYFLEAEEINPQNDEVKLAIAETFIRTGNKEKAILVLKENIKLNPKYVNYYITLGIIYEEDKEFEEAINYYDMAIEISQQNEMPYLRKAYILGKQNKFKESLDLCEKAISVNQKNYLSYLQKGMMYLRLEKYEDAILIFSKAIVINPNDYATYNNRGNCYFFLKDYEKAINDFNEVIKINVRESRAYGNKGICLLHVKKYYEAIEAFKEEIKYHPSDYNIYINLGTCYALVESYELAIEYFNKCVEIDDKDFKLFFNFGLVYNKIGDYKNSVIYFDKAIELNANQPSLFFYRGISHFRIGNNENAIKDLTKFKSLFIDEQDRNIDRDDDTFIDWMEEVWINSDIEFMMTLIVNLFELNEYDSLGEKYINIAKIISRINEKEDIKIESNVLKFINEIFLNYPGFNGSINYHYNNDGKDLFEINFKLCMLENMVYKILKLEENNSKNRIIMKLFFLINKSLRKGNLEKVKKNETEKLESIKRANEKLEKMVQQYTHTLSNTLFPSTIFSVSQKIAGNQELKKEAIKLRNAYNSEIQVKKQGQLLQIRYSGDSVFFQQYIRNDRLELDEKDNAISVSEIINNSIEYIINRFLNVDYHRLSEIRERVLRIKNISLSELKDSFEENVVVKRIQKPIEWSNEYFLKMNIKYSEIWNKIRLKEGNYSEALLQGYFSELIFNALKYGNHRKEKWVDIDFGEEKFKDKEYLYCKLENDFDIKKEFFSGKKGLESIENDLKMLNNNSRSLIISGNDKFEIKLYFCKDLFVINKKIEYDIKKIFG